VKPSAGLQHMLKRSRGRHASGPPRLADSALIVLSTSGKSVPSLRRAYPNPNLTQTRTKPP
jgi:hypothetical protein